MCIRDRSWSADFVPKARSDSGVSMPLSRIFTSTLSLFKTVAVSPSLIATTLPTQTDSTITPWTESPANGSRADLIAAATSGVHFLTYRASEPLSLDSLIVLSTRETGSRNVTVPENQRITRSSSPSTEASAQSASTRTGSCHWRMLRRR